MRANAPIAQLVE